jgi:hypothetical protein
MAPNELSKGLQRFVALFFVRGRSANMALLIALILLFLVPYWEHGAAPDPIARHYGYS